MSTILIKNGLVYDGTGKPPIKKDVFVSGDRIARLGTFSKKHVDEVIDAAGGLVMPGFIDINTDSDHHLSLFSEPYQEDFLKQGVTTTIGGNCGASLAPLINGSIESISQWGDPHSINVNWHYVADFLGTLEKRGLGVNFGTLLGHTTVRQALLGDHLRDLTTREITAFRKIVSRALKEGAFGISFGLGYSSSRNTAYKEIESLALVVRREGGVLAIHLRNTKERLAEAVREAVNLTKGTHVNLEISHFEPLSEFRDEYLEAVDRIEKESALNRINFDVYPFLVSALPLYAFLPERYQIGGLENMLRQIELPHLKKELLRYFIKKFKPSDLTIGQAPAHLKFLEGKTLEEFSSGEKRRWPDSFLALMRLTQMKAIIFYKNIDEEVLERFMTSPCSIISSNGASLPKNCFGHPRNRETFPKFLNWVSDKNLMPLEKAVAKITSIPADKYRIKKRGLIKEGYFADIVILRDFSPWEVLLNGKIAVKDGKHQKILAGSILKA